MSTMDWGAETVVNSVTAGDQSAPQISALSNGGWVVVWETGSPGSQTANGQVFNADGIPIGGELTFAGTSSEQVHVADTNDGTFYVAWLNNPQPNSNGVITAEEFNDNTAAAIGIPTAYTTLFGSPPADTIGSLAMTIGPDGADSTGSFQQAAAPSVVYATSGSDRWGYQAFYGVAGETSTASSHTWTNVDGGYGLTGPEIVATDTSTSNIEYQSALFSAAIDVSTDTATTNGDNADLPRHCRAAKASSFSKARRHRPTDMMFMPRSTGPQMAGHLHRRYRAVDVSRRHDDHQRRHLFIQFRRSSGPRRGLARQ